MDPSVLTTPAALFAAGVVASVHCCGMCGPLSCAVLPRKKTLFSTALYHAGRAASYMAVGGLLGALGHTAASAFASVPVRILPWAMILLFVILGLGLESRIPMPAPFSRFLLRFRFGGVNSPGPVFLLGLATPFIPCAPLYLAFGIAIFSGSFFAGTVLMAAFLAGTLPLYWLFQVQFARIGRALSPQALVRVRRGLAWVCAILIAWRVTAGGGSDLSHAHCIFCL